MNVTSPPGISSCDPVDFVGPLRQSAATVRRCSYWLYSDSRMSPVPRKPAVNRDSATISLYDWRAGFGSLGRCDWRIVLDVGPTKQISVLSLQAHFLCVYNVVADISGALYGPD